MAAPMLMQWGISSAGRPLLTGPLQCTPVLFVDGVLTAMPAFKKTFGQTPFTSDQSRFPPPAAFQDPDLDNVLPFALIGGIEVYAPTEAPARFADPTGRCSSIVIWSKGAVR